MTALKEAQDDKLATSLLLPARRDKNDPSDSLLTTGLSLVAFNHITLDLAQMHVKTYGWSNCDDCGDTEKSKQNHHWHGYIFSCVEEANGQETLKSDVMASV